MPISGIPDYRMKELGDIILRINGFSELQRTLDLMSGEIERLSASTSRVTAEEVQAMASYITQIRLLVNELERSEVCVKGASRELADRLLEIDGMIKALRSDLDQIMMRVSA